MNLQQMKDDLVSDEGYRAFVYEDSEGYQTIGVGFLVDHRRGTGLSMEECMLILDQRIQAIYKQLNTMLPWFHMLSDGRQRAVVNMAYQLGVNGLLQFKDMLAALRIGDYAKAEQEALNSKWAKQTPMRAKRIASMLRTG